MISRKDFSILIGNMLDHYDTALYGFLVPVLSPVFFPNEDAIIGLILGYSIFITSFFTGPIGSIIFSLIAEYKTPLIALSYSLIGLSVTTTIIGLLPGHTKLGTLAPGLLIIMRIMQAIFAAGEQTIAKLYLIENKCQDNQRKASYYYQISSMLGIVLASFATTVVYFAPNNNMYWRLCFLLGGLTGIIGFVVRGYSSDILYSGLSFRIYKKSAGQAQNNNTLQSLWQYRKEIVAIALTSSFSYLTYSLAFILMNSLVPQITNISLKTMMELNSILLILDIILIPIIGHFSNKYDIKHLLINSCLIFAITIVPLIYYLEASTLWYVIIARIWIIILGVVFSHALNTWYFNLHITQNKYLIIGLASSLGNGTLGKATPALSLLIWYSTNSLLILSIYFAIIALMTAYLVSELK